MEDMSKLIEEKVNDHEDTRNSSSRMVSQTLYGDHTSCRRDA